MEAPEDDDVMDVGSQESAEKPKKKKEPLSTSSTFSTRSMTSFSPVGYGHGRLLRPSSSLEKERRATPTRRGATTRGGKVPGGPGVQGSAPGGAPGVATGGATGGAGGLGGPGGATGGAPEGTKRGATGGATGGGAIKTRSHSDPLAATTTGENSSLPDSDAHSPASDDPSFFARRSASVEWMFPFPPEAYFSQPGKIPLLPSAGSTYSDRSTRGSMKLSANPTKRPGKETLNGKRGGVTQMCSGCGRKAARKLLSFGLARKCGGSVCQLASLGETQPATPLTSSESSTPSNTMSSPPPSTVQTPSPPPPPPAASVPPERSHKFSVDFLLGK